jgi:hypothetical protein
LQASNKCLTKPSLQSALSPILEPNKNFKHDWINFCREHNNLTIHHTSTTNHTSILNMIGSILRLKYCVYRIHFHIGTTGSITYQWGQRG